MKQFFIISSLLLGVSINAQNTDIEPINTDRPDQSDGSFTLQKGLFQIENGVTLSDPSWGYDLMLRYGIGKSTEVRLASDFGNNAGISQFEDAVLSVKQRLLRDKEYLPDITLIGYLTYNNSAENQWQGDLLLAFDKDITDSFATSFNIGSTSGFSTYTLTNGWYYSFNKFTIFGEYFANFTPSETPQHNLDFGIMYPITSNLQIDFAFGRSIFSNTANAFATTGIAYRFLNKKYRKH